MAGSFAAKWAICASQKERHPGSITMWMSDGGAASMAARALSLTSTCVLPSSVEAAGFATSSATNERRVS